MTKKYDQEKGEILTFKNSEGYNDFIAISTNQEKAETLPFSALFKDNTLYFKGKYYRYLPKNNSTFIGSYINSSLLFCSTTSIISFA